jgi:hypothetical protein
MRRRIGEEGGMQTHRSCQNWADQLAEMADSDEKICSAQRCFRRIERGEKWRASRAL